MPTWPSCITVGPTRKSSLIGTGSPPGKCPMTAYTFYSIDKRYMEKLQTNMHAFAPKLPKNVIVRYYPPIDSESPPEVYLCPMNIDILTVLPELLEIPFQPFHPEARERKRAIDHPCPSSTTMGRQRIRPGRRLPVWRRCRHGDDARTAGQCHRKLCPKTENTTRSST